MLSHSSSFHTLTLWIDRSGSPSDQSVSIFEDLGIRLEIVSTVYTGIIITIAMLN